MSGFDEFLDFPEPWEDGGLLDPILGGTSGEQLSAYKKFMRELEEGRAADPGDTRFTPCKRRLGTFLSDLTPDQRSYYLHWRSLALKGVFAEADDGYLLLLANEIVNGCGWSEPEDGFELLMKLVGNYRDQFGSAVSKIEDVAIDFALYFNVERKLMELEEDYWPTAGVLGDFLVDAHSGESPVRLPFGTIEMLSDYRILNSKFYNSEHRGLCADAIPKAVSFMDQVERRTRNAGILQIRGTRLKSFSIISFDGLIVPQEMRWTEGEVPKYSENKRLTNHIGQIVKFTENELRKLYHYRPIKCGGFSESEGRLLSQFIQRHFSPDGRSKASPAPGAFQIDPSLVDDVRKESDAVREALRVEEEGQPTELSVGDLGKCLKGLSEKSKEALLTLSKSSWEIPSSEAARMLYDEAKAFTDPMRAKTPFVFEGGSLKASEGSRAALEFIMENLRDTIGFPEPEAAPEAIGGALGEFWASLNAPGQGFIRAVLFAPDPSARIQAIAEEFFTMPELIADEINSEALDHLDDILLEFDGEGYVVLEEYRGSLMDSLKGL